MTGAPEPLASSTELRLTVLFDRAEIVELIDRYIASLDTAERGDRDAEWYRRIFTDEVRLIFPIGERQGITGLPDFQRQARLSWRATHHLGANHVVDLQGSRALIRVQVIGVHIDHEAEAALGLDPAHRMDMGGYYEAEALRTSRGWRIDHLRFVLVWTSGGGTPRAGPPQPDGH
jgi:hypothetical protein